MKETMTYAKIYDYPTTIEEAYEKCQPLIRGSVLGFIKRYGGDLDELTSRANLSLVIAYRKYNRARAGQGGFGQRVCGVIMNDLLDEKRTNAKKHCRQPTSLKTDVADNRRREEINPLSPDAQMVVDLATIEFANISPNKARKVLVKTLSELGWSLARITESFREIQEALLS